MLFGSNKKVKDFLKQIEVAEASNNETPPALAQKAQMIVIDINNKQKVRIDKEKELHRYILCSNDETIIYLKYIFEFLLAECYS